MLIKCILTKLNREVLFLFIFMYNAAYKLFSIYFLSVKFNKSHPVIYSITRF